MRKLQAVYVGLEIGGFVNASNPHASLALEVITNRYTPAPGASFRKPLSIARGEPKKSST
jgi:hypothetical protein